MGRLFLLPPFELWELKEAVRGGATVTAGSFLALPLG